MSRDELYEQAAAEYAPAIERLARSYEADPDKRRDLLQDLHFALWRSFERFDARCSLRTWVYRVAHNVAASHVTRQLRAKPLMSLDDVELADTSFDRAQRLAQLYAFIEQLKPLDREVILLYLEGLEAASIAEITGLSASNVATKIHRIKRSRP